MSKSVLDKPQAIKYNNNMKKYSVNFKLREVPASKYYQSATVEASNVGLAVNRAWAEVKKRDGIKGKRIKNVDISVYQLEDDGEL